ncbi:MAG: oligosaccharide flippase family protein [Rubrobacter sp.]|nr:oligosaccharide flippase family protein [Rubrobacter sp.]
MRNLLSAVVKTGAGSLAVLILGALATKVLAVVVGPAGIGLLSVLRQIQQTAVVIGPVGGQPALVQGLASREGEERLAYLGTTFWIFVLGTAAVAVFLLGAAPLLAPLLFDDSSAHTVSLVRWLTLPVSLAVAQVYFIGLLNGFQAIGRLALVKVFYSLVLAALAYPVALLVSAGYVVAFIFMTSIGLAASLALAVYMTHRAGWLRPLATAVRSGFDRRGAGHFFSIAGTTLVTMTATTGALLAIRAITVRHGGLAAAGMFDVAWTLSQYYITLVLTTFTTYYLPALSGENDPGGRALLIEQVLRLSTMLMVPLITTVVVLKPLVVQVLYSSDFMPALEIVRWMLIGDYLKVTGWIFGLTILAYANMKVFFWKETLSQIGLLSFCYAAIAYFQELQGIGVGILLMYAVNLAYVIYYVADRHDFFFSGRLAANWGIGLALVLGASWHTWSDVRVAWIPALLWVGAAVCFAALSLRQSERKAILRLVLRQKEALT